MASRQIQVIQPSITTFDRLSIITGIQKLQQFIALALSRLIFLGFLKLHHYLQIKSNSSYLIVHLDWNDFHSSRYNILLLCKYNPKDKHQNGREIVLLTFLPEITLLLPLSSFSRPRNYKENKLHLKMIIRKQTNVKAQRKYLYLGKLDRTARTFTLFLLYKAPALKRTKHNNQDNQQANTPCCHPFTNPSSNVKEPTQKQVARNIRIDPL